VATNAPPSADARGTSSTKVACTHCGLPVPPALRRAGAAEQFCCHGCEAVYQTLQSCGLDQYYRVRDALDAPTAPAPPTPDTEQGYATFDAPAFREAHVQTDDAGPHHIDLRLSNVHCAACLWLIERLPRVCPGVIESRLSLRQAVVRITWDPEQTRLSQIATALHRLGYPPTPHRAGTAEQRDARRDEERRQWVRIGLAGVCAGNAMLLAFALYAGMFEGMEPEYVHFFRLLSALIGMIALVGPGSVFFRGAWAALRVRAINLDVPIALALGVGAVAGTISAINGRGEIYFDSLSVLVLLLLVGRYLQFRQQRWADETVGLLMAMTPVTCRVVRGGVVERVPIEAVRPGDVAEVRAGELFPADGELSSGRSTVERALLTGESQPQAIDVGEPVYAGTRNLTRDVRVRVDHVGEDTRVGRLMRQVHSAVGHKPRIVQLADRIAGVFVVVVTAAATLTMLGWGVLTGQWGAATNHTVALLIVACPCALALTTPLTLAVATGLAARHDILIKRAAVLEMLERGGRVWFDKTGTLTRGQVELAEWIGPAWIQSIVAELERNSNHPIGQSLATLLGDSEADARDRAQLHDREEAGNGGVSATLGDSRVRVGSPRFIHDHGVALPETFLEHVTRHESAGHTVVVVAIGGRAVALAALGDRLRPEAKGAIAQWRAGGWRPGLISGDSPRVVRRIAEQLGLPQEDTHGGVLPEDKCDLVKQRTGRTIMIGDGVNDAAALAAADLGIAVRGGAEASMAAADIYLARPGLAPLSQLLRLSRRVMRVIRLNLTLSLTYNAIAIGLAAAGLINPLVAAILMPLSSGAGLAVAVFGLKWRNARWLTAPTPGGRG